MCINEHVYRLRAAVPLTQSYVYFWLTTPLMMEEMRRRGTGAAIPGLNSTSVKEMPIIVPPDDLVRRFDEVGDRLLSRILISSRVN